jgi:membrane associated rhomboid family serine protease
MKWHLRDYIFFFAFVPLVLALIFVLPDKSSLILHPTDPTLLSVFFSNYIHLEFWHFFANLAMYLIVIFVLFNIETDKKMFYRISALLFIALPIVSSLSIIYFLPQLKNTVGFSAVVAGFLGYLLYATYNYAKRSLKAKISSNSVTALFGLNVAISAFDLGSLITGAACLVIALYFIYTERKGISDLSRRMRLRIKDYRKQGIRRYAMMTLFFIAWIALLFWLIALLYMNVENGTMTNIFAHYVGYMFGLFVPFALEGISKTRMSAKRKA